MHSLYRYKMPPSQCGYLPDQLWSLEYEYVADMTKAEYLQRMLDGWRRFGHMMFRPACASCQACRALRIRVAEFHPDRSQRRCRKANEGTVELRIGRPSVTQAKLSLYDRYHAFQSDHKGWREHEPKEVESYADSYVIQPFDVEEWCFYLDNRLVGVGYVDSLPDPPAGDRRAQMQGLSAIYFFYEPEERHRGLGTWNVLCLIEEARKRGMPFVYLGYFVEGSASMTYKSHFVPNELRGDDGQWRLYRS